MVLLQEQLDKIVKATVKAILADTMQHVSKRDSFTDIVISTKKNINELGRQVLSRVIEEVERQFDAARNRHKIIVRNKNKTRHLITEFGDIEVKHTLYFDKDAGRYFFAIDELLRLEKYSRIEESMQAKLISDATITSYGKAASLSNNAVSRQSVYNIAKKIKTVEAPQQKTNWNAPNIYIEADEDHIHLKNGKPGEVRLVYVHEGTDCSSGRAELINPRYFTSTSSDCNEIWDRVGDYLMSAYRAYKAKVLLTGDGANWIKAGLYMLPNMIYNLDKFHLSKALITLSRGDKNLLSGIRRVVYDGDRQAFDEICMIITQRKMKDVAERRAVSDSMCYISSNFDAISAQSRCSAEGHVSHILSARMSSRPMAWTREGAGKIASLRAYLYNKGDFLTLIREGKKRQQVAVRSRGYNSAVDMFDGVKGKSKQQPYSIPGIEHISGALAIEIKYILKNL